MSSQGSKSFVETDFYHLQRRWNKWLGQLEGHSLKAGKVCLIQPLIFYSCWNRGSGSLDDLSKVPQWARGQEVGFEFRSCDSPTTLYFLAIRANVLDYILKRESSLQTWPFFYCVPLWEDMQTGKSRPPTPGCINGCLEIQAHRSQLPFGGVGSRRTFLDLPRPGHGMWLAELLSTLWPQEKGATLAIHEHRDLIGAQAAADCQLSDSIARTPPHSPGQRFCEFIPGPYSMGEGTQYHTSHNPKMRKHRTEHKLALFHL